MLKHKTMLKIKLLSTKHQNGKPVNTMEPVNKIAILIKPTITEHSNCQDITVNTIST